MISHGLPMPVPIKNDHVGKAGKGVEQGNSQLVLSW